MWTSAGLKPATFKLSTLMLYLLSQEAHPVSTAKRCVYSTVQHTLMLYIVAMSATIYCMLLCHDVK